MRRALLAFPVAAALLLAGCGGSGSSDAKATTAPTSVTPSPSAPTTSTTPVHLNASLPLAPGSQAESQGSANTFARYALQMLMYSYERRDMAPFDGIAAAACPGCKTSAAWVRQQKAGHFRQIPDAPAKITTVYAKPATTGQYDVLVTFDQSAGQQVRDDGTVMKSLPPAKGSKFEVTLAWSSKGWQVSDYTLTWGSAT